MSDHGRVMNGRKAGTNTAEDRALDAAARDVYHPDWVQLGEKKQEHAGAC